MRKVLLGFVCVFLFIASAQTQTIIVDDLHDGFSITGSWTQTSDSSQRHASTYYETDSSSPQTATALWMPDFPSTGSYTVDIWYTDGADRVSDAFYMVGYP